MRYVVDTNVVSELMKANPQKHVLGWLLEHEDETYLTSVTIEEISFGVERLAEGARKMGLATALESIISRYRDRILAFDATCGRVCGQLHAQEIASGFTPTVEDLMIASMAVVHRATLVTRNVRDFERFPLEILNPFA